MWLKTLEGCTWMGWMSATVSTSMSFFSSSSLISSVSARIDTSQKEEIFRTSVWWSDVKATHPARPRQAWGWWRSVGSGGQFLQEPEAPVKRKNAETQG